MAAPVDASRATTGITTASTFWTVNYPTGIVAGDLLLSWHRHAAGGVGGPPSAWIPLVSNENSDATDDVSAIYWKVAVGGESGTLTYDFSTSGKGAVIIWRITGADDPAATALGLSTVTIGTTTANTADPGPASVTGGPKDTLYVAMAGGGGETGAYTGAPTNYTNLAADNSGTGGSAASNVFIGGATRQILASSSDDPGAFTHGAHTGGWCAFTVAVAPAPPLISNVVPIHIGKPRGLGASY